MDENLEMKSIEAIEAAAAQGHEGALEYMKANSNKVKLKDFSASEAARTLCCSCWPR